MQLPDVGSVYFYGDIVTVDYPSGTQVNFRPECIDKIYLTNTDLVTIDRIDWEIWLSGPVVIRITEDFKRYQEFSEWLGTRIKVDWEAMITHQTNAFTDQKTLFFSK